MIRFSEYVSLGHPDKVADYISQYLLDRYIERDPDTRYAVEVQIKGWHVSLGGEVTSRHKMTVDEIRSHVRAAVNNIGYTRAYMDKWGEDNTICGDLLDIDLYIGQQSPDIAQGLSSGWGAEMCIRDRSCAMTCSTAASEGWTSKRRSSWTTTGLSRSL